MFLEKPDAVEKVEFAATPLGGRLSFGCHLHSGRGYLRTQVPVGAHKGEGGAQAG